MALLSLGTGGRGGGGGGRGRGGAQRVYRYTYDLLVLDDQRQLRSWRAPSSLRQVNTPLDWHRWVRRLALIQNRSWRGIWSTDCGMAFALDLTMQGVHAAGPELTWPQRAGTRLSCQGIWMRSAVWVGWWATQPSGIPEGASQSNRPCSQIVWWFPLDC